MENPARLSRGVSQRRSGYEPSDAETDWNESPWNDHHREDRLFGSDNPIMLKSNFGRNNNISPMKLSRRTNSSRFEFDQGRRKNDSKSPCKPQRSISPLPGTESRRRNISPYKAVPRELDLYNNHESGISNKRTPSYHRRSVTAPRTRLIKDYDRQSNSSSTKSTVQKPKEASRLKSPTVGETNEMIANSKISKSGLKYNNDTMIPSTDSISPDDIFFSRDHISMGLQNNVKPKKNVLKSYLSPKGKVSTDSHQQVKAKGYSGYHVKGNSSGTGLSTFTTTNSGVNSEKVSTDLSTKMSDTSGTTTTSMRKFTANRRKSQSETNWFACMRKGSCRTAKKSPEKRAFDEASFIEKAFVVENLRQFWADKHQPNSLNGFICHKQSTQLLKQLVSHDVCPHILFKGPPGSGKKALTMALLHQIYGDACLNVSHDLRYFQIQERRPMEVIIPLTSSAHHVELNVRLEPNIKFALMGLIKEISNEYSIPPEMSNVNFGANYKVIVLNDVDKVAENVQHLIKWIMDCYTDVRKLILCCEDDSNILESVKTRCKVIEVTAPVTNEIIEVLMQIARKEDFDLPLNFASKIATKSKQNVRNAIMALEACKAQNYPFVDEQLIPIGWEEAVMELSEEILANPSPTRLYFIKEKIEKLLLDFVPPKMILQKLVEQFLKKVEGSLKRELYYWHAYYNKRLPTGTTAMLKLEEFVAKFMSIYRKSSSSNFHHL